MSKSLTDKRNPAISLLKIIAMLFIMNSHFDPLFPQKLSFLATGGALGNELFFLVGGYLYSTKREFGLTTYRRFIRLYIPTYIMTIILYIFGVISIYDLTSCKEIVYRIIWPTSFWFVSAIFLNGILLHQAILHNLFVSKRRIILFFGILIMAWVSLYVFFIPNKGEWIVEDYKFFDGMIYYKCVYSFAVFCIGYLIKNLESIGKMNINEKILFPGALASFIVFFVFKTIFKFKIIPMQLQLIIQPITVICVVFIMMWILNSKRICNWLNYSDKVKRVINDFGEITLEAFLVQFEIINIIKRLDIVFPFNYLITMAIIIVISYLFHQLNNIVCRYLINIRSKSTD